MKGNIVVTDIKGNVHDVQAYLDEGKTVIIDYSTVWCGPCWQLHHSGVLDELHKRYGPDGTNEIVILWIEIDDNTTLGNIQGNGGNNSQGDWTKARDGSEWPIPIINDVKRSPSLDPLVELYEGFVPTLFMVCPSGAYRDIGDELRGPDGVNVTYSLLGTCPENTSSPVISPLSGPMENYVARENEFKASFFSLDDATATLTFDGGAPDTKTWTAKGGTKTASTETAATVTWEKAGTYEIKLEVTNANGTAEKTQTIEILDVPTDLDDKAVDFEAIMATGAFAADFFPHSWIGIDKDKGNVWADFHPQGMAGQSSFVIVDKRAIDSLDVPSIEPYEGNKCALSLGNQKGIRNNDWFVSPKIQLGDESSISLYVRSGWEIPNAGEAYQIAVSTTDQDPTASTFTSTFTPVGGKRTVPYVWTKVEVDLSAYNNQNVYIAINNVGKDYFTFLVDNVEIKTSATTSVNRLLSDRFDIYPNPAKNTVHINCPDLSGIQLFDIRGKEVMNVAANSENETINVSNLPEGHYLIMVRTKENKFGTQKITVIKE
ncbi:MAG: choice-of-anchor J domain-containing protein [Prevotellaceae bacterium]|nr:choice-of-anchor J domain-containing protein [Prevotellaceae bacterium]